MCINSSYVTCLMKTSASLALWYLYSAAAGRHVDSQLRSSGIESAEASTLSVA